MGGAAYAERERRTKEREDSWNTKHQQIDPNDPAPWETLGINLTTSDNPSNNDQWKNEFQARLKHISSVYDKRIADGTATQDDKYKALDSQLAGIPQDQRPHEWVDHYNAVKTETKTQEHFDAQNTQNQQIIDEIKGFNDWYKGQVAAEDVKREGIYNQLMADAELTPERVNKEVGQAADYVGGSYDKAAENQKRGLTSMGIDPSSGRYVSSDRQASLDKARAVGGAKGLTRSNLIQDSQNRKERAQYARMGLTPLSISATPSVQGMVAGAEGNAASAYGNQGNAWMGYGLTQQQLANDNYWNQKNLDYQKQMDNQAMWSDIIGAGLTTAGYVYGGPAGGIAANKAWSYVSPSRSPQGLSYTG